MDQDPVLLAARERIVASFGDIRRNIEDVSAEGLNWKPGPETNSLTAITTHAIGATRNWVCIAVSAPWPERDRASEFLATAQDATALVAYLDSIEADCLRLIDDAHDIDWAAIKKALGGREMSAVAALVNAVDHLREHVGQLFLTRQLWEQKSGR
jgi:hypothetical protein